MHTAYHRPRSSIAAVLLLAGSVAAVLAGCAKADDGKVHVAAGFYPLAFVAQEVGGDLVTVDNLTKAGAEPHDLELSTRQVAGIADADLVLLLGAFQPAVDAAAADAGDHVLDVATVDGFDLRTVGGRPDPHFWLDPDRLVPVTRAVADRLATADPDHADRYRANAADLVTRLRALDRELMAAVDDCASRVLVTNHAAFDYLAARYDLEARPVLGTNPDQEPTAQELAASVSLVRRDRVPTIFLEPGSGPSAARTVADETGVATSTLDPVEGPPPARAGAPAGTYLTAMQANGRNLHRGLGCR